MRPDGLTRVRGTRCIIDEGLVEGVVPMGCFRPKRTFGLSPFRVRADLAGGPRGDREVEVRGGDLRPYAGRPQPPSMDL